MAKAKKRVATRKKISKRGKASSKPARKKAAKRTASKMAKSKDLRAKARQNPRPRKCSRIRPGQEKYQKKASRQLAEAPVETMIIDVIEEPVPGVVVVTEYESVRTVTPVVPSAGTDPGTEKQ